jgi:hypothetical protein
MTTGPVSRSFDGVEMDEIQVLIGILNQNVRAVGEMMKQAWTGYEASKWTGPDSEKFKKKLTAFDQQMRWRIQQLKEAAATAAAIRQRQIEKSK